MNTYYTEYANHIFRYYFSDPPETDSPNYLAGKSAAEKLPEDEREILRAVYTSGIRRMSEAVQSVSDESGFSVQRIYSILRLATRLAAVERGLIE